MRDVRFDPVLSGTSRRSFLFRLVSLPIGFVGHRPTRGHALQPPKRLNPAAPRFFTDNQRGFVSAAVDRLLPADAHGPGGVAAEVPRYIDLQLAGAWGRGEDRYVAGPVGSGPVTLGNQSVQSRAAFYRTSIAALRALPAGRDFPRADPAARDAFLTSLQ